MTTRKQVLQKAASYLGYTERRTKVHPQGNVTIFWDALKPSYQGGAWCAAYVQYCLRECGIVALLEDIPLPYYTPSMEAWAKRQGIWRNSRDLLPGDVLIFTEDATVHTGFLEAQKGDSVQTLEGNTSPGNSGSQANGGGVYRRLRHRSWVRGGISLAAYYSTIAQPNTGRPSLLDVDGQMGPATVDALQWYLDIDPRDGAMDRLANRVMQTWLARPRTGVFDAGDVKALQIKVGATVDGAWGPATTSGLQRFLNRRITDAVKKGAA